MVSFGIKIFYKKDKIYSVYQIFFGWIFAIFSDNQKTYIRYMVVLKKEKFFLVVCMAFLFAFSVKGIFAPIDTSDYIPGDLNFNLLVASEKGYAREVIRLLKKGADVNTKTYEGVTPLVFATINDDTTMVETLLKNDADPDIAPYDGKTPLILATLNNNLKIGELLLQYDADTEKVDNEGLTPLIYAAYYDLFYFADMLIFFDADIEKSDEKGTTPLMIACLKGYYDMVDLLVRLGANTEKKDQYGYTPLMVAAQNGHLEIVELLVKENIVDIDALNNEGYSALALAVKNGHTEVVKWLIDHEAEYKTTFHGSQNLLTLAQRYNQGEIQKYLISKGFKRNYGLVYDKSLIGCGFDFSSRDLFFRFYTGLIESRYGFELQMAYALRGWAVPTLIEDRKNVYYQHWERRSLFSLNMNKDIRLLLIDTDKSTGINLGMGGCFTYGRYSGRNERARALARMVPSVGFYYRSGDFKVQMLYEYLDLNLIDFPTKRVNLTVQYDFNLGYGKLKNKTLRWE